MSRVEALEVAQEIARKIKSTIPLYIGMNPRSHSDAFTDSDAVNIIADELMKRAG